ncbi:MAG: HAD family phosphatase [Lachnospiraceae bacterium]|nr:HAD family phosphatase [Lachnospiraceae bacterium]
MAIKNLVFDIGNVLLAFCWEKHLTKLGMSGEIFDRVAQATVKDPLWNEMDRGVMSSEELLKGFIRNDPGVEQEIRRMVADLYGIVEEYPYTESWLLQLKESGYGIYALSNYSEQAYHDTREKMRFLDLLDGYILSYREKLIKPDPAIYRLLLSRYHLNASECIFMDDTQANVDMAIQCGMEAFLFKGRDSAVRELVRRGVDTR